METAKRDVDWFNEEKTRELNERDVMKRYKEWLKENGAEYSSCEVPACFGDSGTLTGAVSLKEIAPF